MIKNNSFINYDLFELSPIPSNINQSIASYLNEHGLKEHIILKKRSTKYSNEQTRVYSSNSFPEKITISTVELYFNSDKFPDSVALNVTESNKEGVDRFNFKDFQEFLLKGKR
ncbi:MAG: hypothetical protein AABW81_04605 [Nanoarchaeota archaeon]